MHKGLILCFTAALPLEWTSIGFAQQTTSPQQCKIPVEVWQKVQKDGVVRIIVQLNVPTKPEALLDQQSVLAQRQAIAAAQNELISSLSGTKHMVIRRLESIPFVGLEVGVDALVVLILSPIVLGVELSRTFAPQG